MPLDPGVKLGPYEIVAPIGAGGMGEVYRARDTRLDRAVAVKILPAGLASDPEALARFEREARAVAALSHPNILAIHDFGSEGGIAYSVTEMLEGESLARKIDGSPLPTRKAIDYAVQAARGLAAAHDRGIVHRDLKPENLFVTHDGRVKILDFGLAKISPLAENRTATPTLDAGTKPGTMMGTIGYMSPEQVRGLEVDHRTDIFSFGAILHEMLAGTRAFHRETPADTLSAILKEDPPDLPPMPGGAPAGLQGLIRHCLEKNPAERFQSARDLAFHLEAIGSGTFSGIAPAPAPGAVAAGPSRARRPWNLIGAALALGVVLGTALGLWVEERPIASSPAIRYLSYTGADREPSASPDGRVIAYSSDRGTGAQIWLRQEPSGDEIALTQGPADLRPRISPDGSQVLFVHASAAGSSLHRVPSLGGQSRKILDDAYEGDWSPDGRRIVFVRRLEEGATVLIGVADASGEAVREIARVRAFRLSSPRWSPDGTLIAALIADGENAPTRILVLDSDGKSTRTVVPPPPGGTVSALAWTGSGPTVVYSKSDTLATANMSRWSLRIVRQDVSTGRAETLMRVPFITSGLDVLGEGRLVMDSLVVRRNLYETSLQGAERSATTSRWLTRGNSSDRQPAYSPDGEWIIFSSNRSGNLDLWKISTTTGALHRMTEDAADDWDPAFTPDGKQILWSSSRTGHFEIWIGNADGTGARQVTQDGYDAENPTATPDGRWIVYNSSNPEKLGLWMIRPDGTGERRVVEGAWSTPEVSPDGQYVAFRTTDQDRRTVMAARLSDGLVTKVPTSLPGENRNGRVRWMPDGKRLAFIGTDESGRTGVYVQEFSMTQDTTATRVKAAGFHDDHAVESFGISPDGARIVTAEMEEVDSLIVAEDVPKIEPPVRKAP